MICNSSTWIELTCGVSMGWLRKALPRGFDQLIQMWRGLYQRWLRSGTCSSLPLLDWPSSLPHDNHISTSLTMPSTNSTQCSQKWRRVMLCVMPNWLNTASGLTEWRFCLTDWINSSPTLRSVWRCARKLAQARQRLHLPSPPLGTRRQLQRRRLPSV